MIRTIRIAIIVLAALTALACSPRIIERIEYKHDTTFIAIERVDSIYVRDSVMLKEKNDTVYHYVEKIREKYRYIHDTLRIVRIDSVSVERPVEVQIEKPLSWWQNFRLKAFWWLLGGVLLLLLWVFRKPLMKLMLPV